MPSKPYIKPIRQKMTNTWAWTWRCPRTDHPLYAWCGAAFDTWKECADSLEKHWRDFHGESR